MLGNTRLLLGGSLATVLLLVAVPGGQGECCYPVGSDTSSIHLFYTKCGDCTEGTPYCGYGPCNIVGCNCDGGCRRGACWKGRKRREYPGVMEVADRDMDGRISLQETLEYLLNLNSTIPHVKVKRSFHEMDSNSDGYLTLEEIDPDSC